MSKFGRARSEINLRVECVSAPSQIPRFFYAVYYRGVPRV
jgi:hypothetical protein